jgi:Domain of unknown function (DUF397)
MWIKSSYSFANGNCVEVDTEPVADWRKSSHSMGNGDCIEVAEVGHVLVRDSKNPDGPVLAFGREEFGAFLAGIKAGEFGAL